MTIKIERCRNYFRLLIPTSKYRVNIEFISNKDSGYWNRNNAIEAKNMLENLYFFERNNIKFHHIN